MAHQDEQNQKYFSQTGTGSCGKTVSSLQETIVMLSAMIEGAPELMAVEDTEARYVAFNRAYHAEFKKVFGVDLSPGVSMIEVLAHLPEEQQSAVELFKRTIRGEDFTVIHEFGDHRLARRTYELHCFPVRNPEGRIVGGAHIVRDMSDRIQAEAALRASEENYRRIIDSSQDCIKVLDLEGRVLSINPGGRGLMELDQDVRQYIGSLWLESWQGEARQRAAAALERARAGGVGRFRAQGMTVKCTPKWWDETLSPILDAAGRPERLLVIARDVTDQKRAEDELRRSEEEFRNFFESSSGGKVQADPVTGRFLRVNAKLCEMTGYSQQEMLGMTIADLLHPEDRQQQMALYFQKRDSLAAEYVVEKRYLCKDGSVLWVQATVGFLRDQAGKPYRSIAVIQDITQLKRGEEELGRERAFLRQVIDADPSLVFVKDWEGRFLLANQALAQCYGTTVEAITGKTDADFNPNADEVERFLRDDQEVMSTCQVKMIPEEKVTFANGEVRWFSTIKVPLRNPDGICDKLLGVASDVSVRKQAEEALRQSEARLKLAQHAGRVGVFDWDIPADRAIIAGELESIFGLASGAEAGTYENWAKYVHPEDRPRIDEEFRRCILERSIQSEQMYRILRPDGEVRWVEVKGQLQYLDNGLPARMIGTLVDITERKEAEDALRESEGKFRALAENARASFGIVQGQRIVYANPYFAQVSGYSVEELLTMDFPALVHPDFRPMMEERARRRQMGEPVPNHYEFAMLTKSGEKRWVEFSVGTIEYRGNPAIIGTGFDITDRRHAEEALRLRNERLALLSEAAVHLLKAENPETMILELFEKVARLLDVQGYMNFMINDAGDALRLDSYAGVPEDTVLKVRRLEFGQGVCGTVAQRCKPIYATNIQQSGLEMVQLLKAVGIRAYACNPLMAGGRLLGTLAFATTTRDVFSEDDLEFMRTVSQYVAMAKERLRLDGELRRHIDQLAAANAALAEADLRKNEFLAMLAHELRNPLAPIRNAMQVLRMIDLKEPAQQRQGDIIDRQITHMARLLNDLLDVSRITRGKIELNRAPLALADVLAHAVETVRPLMEARHHTLFITPPSARLRVLGDLDRLAQAVGNLLTNAAKYTEEGGRIWLDAAREGTAAVIRVRDTGVGIEPELLPSIFELFTQADHSLARSQGGLGIGLTMVRQLVEMHGGSVEAHSAGLGRGSAFTIRLPALPDKKKSLATLSEPPRDLAAGMPSRRVLVVDDIADTAQSMSELVGLWGHEVRTAYDGPEAVEAARVFKPELVLLDIGLPGMNGYEVASHLRREAGGEKLVIVALTGYGQDYDRKKAFDAGFNHHLVKPVDLGVLRELLARTAA